MTSLSNIQQSLIVHREMTQEMTYVECNPHLTLTSAEIEERLVVPRQPFEVAVTRAPFPPDGIPHLVQLLRRDAGLHDHVRVQARQELIVADPRHLINVESGDSRLESEESKK